MVYHETKIIGYLGGDPTLRKTKEGREVCNFSVAVNDSWRDRQTQERRTKTTWYRIAVWGNRAGTCAKYLRKGRAVLVVGQVSINTYTDDQGERRNSLLLTATDVRFIGGKTSSPQSADDEPIPF